MTSDALRWLEGVADNAEGTLDEALGALGRALEEIAAAQSGVEDALEALSFDPRELEETEERLFALRGLARKHGVMADDLGDFADGLRERVEALDAGEAGLDALRAAVREAEAAYGAAARALRERRGEAAGAPRRRDGGRARAAQDGAGGLPHGDRGGRAGPRGARRGGLHGGDQPRRARGGRSTGSRRAASCRASCWP